MQVIVRATMCVSSNISQETKLYRHIEEKCIRTLHLVAVWILPIIYYMTNKIWQMVISKLKNDHPYLSIVFIPSNWSFGNSIISYWAESCALCNWVMIFPSYLSSCDSIFLKHDEGFVHWNCNLLSNYIYIKFKACRQ